MNLAQLVQALDIDVPVLLHTEEAGTHTLHLYGGRVVIVSPVATAAGSPGADRVTTMAPTVATAAGDSDTTAPPHAGTDPASSIQHPVTTAKARALPVVPNTAAGRRDPVTTDPPASSIEYPASSIQHPASSIDFTVVKGLGAAANANLHGAGIHTWDAVRAADDHTLMHSLTSYQLAKLRDWYEVHIRLNHHKETPR